MKDKPKEKYHPPAEKIDQLVATLTPRELAIGYLRATRRAREAELLFQLLSELCEAETALRASNGEKCVKALQRARQKASTLNQTGESK